MVYLASSMKLVVRDSSRNKSISGIYECRRQLRAHRQRRGRDCILYVTEDRVDRQSHVVRTDLALKGIACGPAEASSKLRFRGGSERTYIHRIFERIVEDAILGSCATAGSSLETDQRERARVARRPGPRSIANSRKI